MNRYSLLIFGAGQIAAGYDSPGAEAILTHAHAAGVHASFNLLGFYDTDASKAEAAAKKWDTQAFAKPRQADVIVICTPDGSHLQSVREAVALAPKLIILEKPVARTLEDVRLIHDAVKGFPVQVNFSRRFVPQFQALAQSIKNYGCFLTGSGLYGKGFVHNGSHMTDLLELLVGEIESAKKLSEIEDFYPDDLTKTVALEFAQGEFLMLAVDCRSYTVFELDLCFEKARVRITDGGKSIEIYGPAASKEYSGYVNLSPVQKISPELNMAMFNLYENASDFLSKGSPLLSPLKKINEGLYKL